ncbi:hypothetical protein ALIPUT_00150 [Alistipes putredinis DSM 17216]|uniref:Uncharacterized protein n=1 Tax=Alistipes putredinis DSM 17216 TaxID=445970 RepID=B0MTR3_9BACT|nr:hypothetical protein ALIPUT_00150 [Alistipes putredinis DSM 17216]
MAERKCFGFFEPLFCIFFQQVLKIVRYLRNLPKRIYSKTAFK